MRLLALLVVLVVLGAMSWIVLDSMDGGGLPRCPEGVTTTTSPVPLEPGLEAVVNRCR